MLRDTTYRDSTGESESSEGNTGGISKRRLLTLLGGGIVGASGVGSVSAASTADNQDASTSVDEDDEEPSAAHLWDDPFPVWEDAEPHRITSSDGTEIHVDETGARDGQSILFIHGANLSRLSWDKQMYNGLDDGFHLAAMDIRGHGLSDKPDFDEDADGTALLADDVHAVITELGLTNPVLVGWSYGGLTTLSYIEHYGTEQISGINLVGSLAKAGPEDEPVYPELRELPSGIEGDKLFAWNLFYDDPTPPDYYYFLAMILIANPESRPYPFDFDDLLPEIDVPALITYGEEDAFVTPAAVENFSENIPDSLVSLYPNTGHSAFWEAPERFNRELRAFVRGY